MMARKTEPKGTGHDAPSFPTYMIAALMLTNVSMHVCQVRQHVLRNPDSEPIF